MISTSLSRRAALILLAVLIAAPALWSQAPDEQKLIAKVVVRVHPDAKLTVDDQPTEQKGERRRFVSPPLTPGKKYVYTFVAEWDKPDSNYETYIVTRKVTVEAGKSVEVDMRKPYSEKGDTLFIRFVPTPPETIDAMMKLAKVGKGDVVYDLGCGNGSLVVAAVKQYHAKRGVGIDLDTQRIREAKAKAKEAGVEEKVEFRQGDVLQVKDLSEATVVTLYMSDELNQQLMPILQKQLKPGARIVSHRFTMGDWKPDKTVMVDLPNEDIAEEKLIHLWTINKK
ncbi:MAG TPA: TIGR03000 domain-containing protein [Gemmataceae bacterium]|nr:TIGR03000 domain-containing protein [Gemmataceae bacterium]